MRKKKLVLTIKCREKCPLHKIEGCCYECPDQNGCEGRRWHHPSDCEGRIRDGVNT